MDSTKRNILYNGIAQVFSKTIRIANQLLLVPFFLATWGPGYYGEWLTLSAIPSIMAFVDIGFGSASSNALVLNYTGGLKQKGADYFKTGFILVSGSVVVGIFLTAIIIILAQWFGWLDKALIPSKDVTLAVIFLMGTQFARFYIHLYDSFYRIVHKAHLYTLINTIGGFVCIGVGILVLVLGYGVVVYSLTMFIIELFFIVLQSIIGRKLVKDLPKGNWNKPIAIETFKKGVGFLANPVASSFYYQGSTFIVRILLGAESVAMFNTVRTACRSVNQMFTIVGQSVFPELQVAIGEGKMELAKKIYSKAIRLILLISIIGVICLMIFGKPVYNWWTNNKLDVPDTLWYIFIGGIMFNALWSNTEVVYRAFNKPFKYALYMAISAISSFLISLILAYPFGLEGVAIGYEMLDILMPILVFPLACNFLGTNWRSVLIGK